MTRKPIPFLSPLLIAPTLWIHSEGILVHAYDSEGFCMKVQVAFTLHFHPTAPDSDGFSILCLLSEQRQLTNTKEACSSSFCFLHGEIQPSHCFLRVSSGQNAVLGAWSSFQPSLYVLVLPNKTWGVSVLLTGSQLVTEHLWKCTSDAVVSWLVSLVCLLVCFVLTKHWSKTWVCSSCDNRIP